MNGKDIELSNKIDKFIKEFEQQNPNIKGHIHCDNYMKFNVDYNFDIDEKEQYAELELIEKAYFNYFGKNLKNRNQMRGKTRYYTEPENGKLNYHYRYEI